jgi:hypothetical protein
MSSSYIARRFVTGGLQLARPMQSMPTTSLASPATSSGRSDLGDERAGLAGAQLVLLQLPPFISRTGQDRAAKPARSGDATRARRWPMSTETLMRRRAAALPEDPSSTVDGVQCDGAGELGLDGLSIGVESREQLAGSRLQALVSYDDDLRRYITCGRCRTPTATTIVTGRSTPGSRSETNRSRATAMAGTSGGVKSTTRRAPEEGSGVRPPVGAAALEPRRAFRAIRASRSIPASLVPSAPRKACAVPQYAAAE